MKWIHDVALVLHVCAGFTALGAFWVAALSRKGGRVHRLVGRVYACAMMLVVFTALVMAFLLALAPMTMRDFTGVPSSEIAAMTARLHGVAGFFVALSLLTVTAGWNGLLAARSHDLPGRRLRIVSTVLAALNVAVVGPMVWLGLSTSEPLLLVFAVVCLMTGAGGLWRRRKERHDRGDWLHVHLTNMIATGIAAHTAFLAVGAVRLFPYLYSHSPALYVIPWVFPSIVGSLAIVLVKRSRLYLSLSRVNDPPLPIGGMHRSPPTT